MIDNSDAILATIEINPKCEEDLRIYAEVLNKTAKPLNAQEWIDEMRRIKPITWVCL